MTVLAVIVVAVIVWCIASVIAAVVFCRVVARADRDAQRQQAGFDRRAAAARTPVVA